jgi:predicted small metal-binding protein
MSKEATDMQRIVRCNCGAEIRSDNERDLIEQVQQHAKSAHDLDLTEEQVLAMMEIEQ